MTPLNEILTVFNPEVEIKQILSVFQNIPWWKLFLHVETSGPVGGATLSDMFLVDKKKLTRFKIPYLLNKSLYTMFVDSNLTTHSKFDSYHLFSPS